MSTHPPGSECPPFSVIILTHNEEANLPACLASLKGLDCDLFVVDSGSTDRTVDVAAGFGAQVVQHRFEGHSQQWQWALASLSCDATWVLGLDADQRLTGPLRQELADLFTRRRQQLEDWDGFYINRRQIFRGCWIKHGGYYPKYLLKLFRREKVRFDHRELMDHHFYVPYRTRKLNCDLIEDNQKEADISFWIDKHTRYALLQAREEYLRRSNDSGWIVQPDLTGSPDQRTIWLKQLWYKLPLYVRPTLLFTYRYFMRRGFLDGRQGFIFHFMQSFWYRLLVDIHLEGLISAKQSARW